MPQTPNCELWMDRSRLLQKDSDKGVPPLATASPGHRHGGSRAYASNSALYGDSRAYASNSALYGGSRAYASNSALYGGLRAYASNSALLRVRVSRPNLGSMLRLALNGEPGPWDLLGPAFWSRAQDGSERGLALSGFR